MLETFLFLWFEWLIRDVDYKYYGYYNNQLFDENREEGVDYPAIFIEMSDIPVNYQVGELGRILNDVMDVKFHIITEKFNTTRGDDEVDKVKSLEHFDFVRQFIRSIEGQITNNDYEREYNIYKDQDKFIIGYVNLVRRENEPTTAGLMYSVITVRFSYVDQCLLEEDLYQDLTVTDVLGTINDDKTGDFIIKF